MRLICLFSLIALVSCGTKNPTAGIQALPKAKAYVESYGQIISSNETRYVEYLVRKLDVVLTKSSGKANPMQVILLNTKKPIASLAGDGLILISRGIVVSLQSEAEFAFILAHEMAHQHLGHDPESLLEEKDESTEIKADRLACATISAAGYDPRLAIAALKNSYKYSAPYIVNESEYPSLETRIDELIDFIDSSGWKPPGIVNRHEFRDFRRALL